MNQELIKGLPYTGSKYKLLPQLLELFPDNINTFIEPFIGGCNVAQNIKANKYILNDKMNQLILIYKMLLEHSTEDILFALDRRIEKFSLSKENKTGYLLLREEYNKHRYTISLLLLIFYSFNHQIRFNKNKEFNLPFGLNRSSFNNKIRQNLIQLSNFLYMNSKIELASNDFASFLSKITYQKDDFVYFDPPYYNTTGTYNEQSGWNESNEQDLFDILSCFIHNNTKFGLSNVFINGLPTSLAMNNFLSEHKDKVKVHLLNKNYNNCNHQRKSDKILQEIYITNIGV